MYNDDYGHADEVIALARDWLAMANSHPAVKAASAFRFAALWMAFNALYDLKDRGGRIRGQQNGDTELAKVLAIAAWDRAQEVHESALSSRNARYRQAIEKLADGVYDHWERKERSIRDTEDLEEVLKVCYTVRGNLFHGHKSPHNARDTTVLDAASVIVEKLVSGLANANHFQMAA